MIFDLFRNELTLIDVFKYPEEDDVTVSHALISNGHQIRIGNDYTAAISLLLQEIAFHIIIIKIESQRITGL